MNSQKFLIGTLVGGIVFFLLGYLFYGMALANFFTEHSLAPAGSMKTMGEFAWWALILGNLANAALLAYVFQKIGNINSFGSAARTAAAIGFFIGLSSSLIRFAVANSSDLTGTLTNVVVTTVMFAIAGGIIGVVLGMGKKKA
jgi:hypothetical protein